MTPSSPDSRFCLTDVCVCECFEVDYHFQFYKHSAADTIPTTGETYLDANFDEPPSRLVATTHDPFGLRSSNFGQHGAKLRFE